MKRVGLVGGRGYVGQELIAILAKHKEVEVAWITSSTQAGARAKETIDAAPSHLRFEAADPALVQRLPVDAVVLALPNGESEAWVDAVPEGCCIVDLSADHRFDDTWTYGYAFRNRRALLGARRVANPGCYATAIQIALEPLLALLHGPAHTFGVSGYSGAGTSPSAKNDPDVLRDNLLPYALVDHTHEREVSRHLRHAVYFMPHVAPFFRGLTVTSSVTFNARVTREEIMARFAEFYREEALVTFSDAAPLVRDAALRHAVNVGGIAVSDDGKHGAIVSTLDNLLGGAATHAVRNLNLALHLSEYEGLST